MGPASCLSSSEGLLHPWAPVTFTKALPRPLSHLLYGREK